MNSRLVNWGRKITFMVIAVLLGNTAVTQDLIYRNFTTTDGLPSQQVYDIFQDDNGYLWFSSDRGIIRYNGDRFDVYGREDGLTCNTVFKFFPQKNGNVWCSTYNNRLFFFNTVDYKFKSYVYNDSLAKYGQSKVIDDLIIAENGAIYVSYIQPGVISISVNGSVEITGNQFNDRSNNILILEKTNSAEIFGYHMLSDSLLNYPFIIGNKHLSQHIILDSTISYINTFQFGELSLFSGGQAVYLKKGDSLIKVIDENKRPINIGYYGDEHFFIGYLEGGVAIYDKSGNLEDKFLRDESVTYVHKDHQNGIWFSTLTSGIYYSSNYNLKQIKGTEIMHVHSLAVDSSEELWLSDYVGGVYKLDKDSLIFKAKNAGLKVKLLDRNENLHEFEYSGPYAVKIGDAGIRLRGSYYLDLSADFNFSRAANGAEILFDYKANDILWNDNELLIGSYNGLYSYDTVINELSKKNEQFIHTAIKDIEAIPGKKLFASEGQGLIVMEGGACSAITKEDGLSSNSVNTILVENDSTIWLGTYSGIDKIIFNERSYFLHSFPFYNGAEVNEIRIIDTKVYIATTKGLFTLDSEVEFGIQQEKFYLTAVKVEIGGITINQNQLYSLSYDQNNLNFFFDVISFHSNKEVQIRYRLEGIDTDWNYTSKFDISYTNIPPGNYKLIVGVRKIGTDWSDEELLYEINIVPPYYLSMWFLIVCAFGLGMLLYLGYKVFNKRKHNEKQVKPNVLSKGVREKKVKEYFVIKEKGTEIKINTKEVLYVQSAGNYIDIKTEEKSFTVRLKIGEFFTVVPDPENYTRLHRSFIVRNDQITKKSKKSVFINDFEIAVSKSNLRNLRNIKF